MIWTFSSFSNSSTFTFSSPNFQNITHNPTSPLIIPSGLMTLSWSSPLSHSPGFSSLVQLSNCPLDLVYLQEASGTLMDRPKNNTWLLRNNNCRWVVSPVVERIVGVSIRFTRCTDFVGSLVIYEGNLTGSKVAFEIRSNSLECPNSDIIINSTSILVEWKTLNHTDRTTGGWTFKWSPILEPYVIKFPQNVSLNCTNPNNLTLTGTASSNCPNSTQGNYSDRVGCWGVMRTWSVCQVQQNQWIQTLFESDILFPSDLAIQCWENPFNLTRTGTPSTPCSNDTEGNFTDEVECWGVKRTWNFCGVERNQVIRITQPLSITSECFGNSSSCRIPKVLEKNASEINITKTIVEVQNVITVRGNFRAILSTIVLSSSSSLTVLGTLSLEDAEITSQGSPKPLIVSGCAILNSTVRTIRATRAQALELTQGTSLVISNSGCLTKFQRVRVLLTEDSNCAEVELVDVQQVIKPKGLELSFSLPSCETTFPMSIVLIVIFGSLLLLSIALILIATTVPCARKKFIPFMTNREMDWGISRSRTRSTTQ